MLAKKFLKLWFLPVMFGSPKSYSGRSKVKDALDYSEFISDNGPTIWIMLPPLKISWVARRATQYVIPTEVA